VDDLKAIKIVLSSLAKLAWELHQRAPRLNLDENIIVDSLVDPGLRIEYIISLLDAAVYSKLPQEFSGQMQNRLLTTADKRGDDFLLPLLTWRWDNYQEQAAALVEFIAVLPSRTLIERAGMTLCEIGRQVDEATLIDLIPYMDRFHRLKGFWTWSNSLEALREKAYYELFLETPNVGHDTSYHDPALTEAVQKYIGLRLVSAQKENQEQRKRLSEYQSHLHDLESQLQDKDAVIRELRSDSGSDSKEGRFEERSRILKELVGTMAEFERYATSQPTRSKEIEAVLRRLENLVVSYKVIGMESIGSLVEFTPQRHRLIEGGDLSPGASVIVVERGYLIRDPQDRLRLLKPALVKKS